MLKWLRENDCPWGTSTCAYAALGGHLEVLKWLRENGCPWTEETREVAASKDTSDPEPPTREARAHLDRLRSMETLRLDQRRRKRKRETDDDCLSYESMYIP